MQMSQEDAGSYEGEAQEEGKGKSEGAEKKRRGAPLKMVREDKVMESQQREADTPTCNMQSGI